MLTVEKTRTGDVTPFDPAVAIENEFRDTSGTDEGSAFPDAVIFSCCMELQLGGMAATRCRHARRGAGEHDTGNLPRATTDAGCNGARNHDAAGRARRDSGAIPWAGWALYRTPD